MRQPRARAPWILITLAAMAATLQAQVVPERPADLAAKTFRHPGLTAEDVFVTPGDLPTKAAAEVGGRLDALGIAKASARLDGRSSRFPILLPATPLIPGKEIGNELRWSDLGVAPKRGDARAEAAWQALRDYLQANRNTLGVDPAELTDDPVLTSHAGGDMIQIHAPRRLFGQGLGEAESTASRCAATTSPRWSRWAT